MKRIRYILFILFISLAGSLFAQSDDNLDLSVEFTTDTARVEHSIRVFAEKDYSTSGMVQACVFSEAEYDKLLNKYYKKLYNSLDDEGKKALKVTQLNWIKLRDSDKELVNALESKTYTDAGGGTIWRVVAADARAEITRRRVIELYNYLTFGDIGG